ERLLADGDPRVAATAARGLVDTGHGEVILGQLHHGHAGVRLAAVAGVRHGRLVTARPRLHHMARFDAAREVRFAAAVTLFLWDDPTADPLMLDAVRSNDPAVWGEAVAQLARRTGAQHGRKVSAWRRELAALRRER
ncbi:MAG: hypothetical protein O2894_14070, partial [Planctomycetota bacterium]|nr:hypothetical protein [Planctomycetota bacterium]